MEFVPYEVSRVGVPRSGHRLRRLFPAIATCWTQGYRIYRCFEALAEIVFPNFLPMTLILIWR